MEISVDYVKKSCIHIVTHSIATQHDAFGDLDGVLLDCDKSNFGTPCFIPLEGRWVVERTFSWMENYRRLTRNYEKLLKVAAHKFIAGCVFFMLRYF